MKCKWYADFEGVCINGECPYRGDICPTSGYPEVCKYAEAKQEPELNAEELVTALRNCASDECKNCPCWFPLSKSDIYCYNRLKKKAADMLEKLAAEKDAKKPDRISVKDGLLEKDIVARARIGKGQDQTEIISRVAYYNDGITFEGYSLDAIPLSELQKEEETHD